MVDVLAAEAITLLGAQRGLVVLEQDDDLRVAAARLPPGEDAAALLLAIRPWLAEVRGAGDARSRHGPDGADPHDQRSCLVVPLIARGSVIGHLYADVDGPQRRFAPRDRDLLTVLASHGAMALRDARTVEAARACVGDTVNLAARLEAHTKATGRDVLIDAATREALDPQLAVESIGAVLFGGKTVTVDVYAVVVR